MFKVTRFRKITKPSKEFLSVRFYDPIKVRSGDLRGYPACYELERKLGTPIPLFVYVDAKGRPEKIFLPCFAITAKKSKKGRLWEPTLREAMHLLNAALSDMGIDGRFASAL